MQEAQARYLSFDVKVCQKNSWNGFSVAAVWPEGPWCLVCTKEQSRDKDSIEYLKYKQASRPSGSEIN